MKGRNVALTTAGVVQRYGKRIVLEGAELVPVRWWPSSGRTGPARPRCCVFCAGLLAADAGTLQRFALTGPVVGPHFMRGRSTVSGLSLMPSLMAFEGFRSVAAVFGPNPVDVGRELDPRLVRGLHGPMRRLAGASDIERGAVIHRRAQDR